MFTYQNIINGNGLNISIVGMSIVFSGLVFISLYIFILPKILGVFDETSSKSKSVSPTAGEAPVIGIQNDVEKAKENEIEVRDIASVIGIVLHMELERSGFIDNQRITIERDESQKSRWRHSRNLRIAPFRRS